MNNNVPCVPDRISDIPEDVITDQILTRLSLKEAARTSLLSKQWKNRWISIPKLVFDYSFSSLSKSDLFKIIYRLLQSHPRKITSFSLCVSSLESCVDIDLLILFLSKHHDVQEFTLAMNDTWNEFHVTSCSLFSFEHLRYLKLSDCAFRLPFVFEGFSHLKSIEFRSVDFDYLNFSKFMEGCPVLEVVLLFDCTHLDSLVVGGPKLKQFDFGGLPSELCFTMSPVLSTLNLDLEYTEEFIEGGDIIESFACLPSLNRLTTSIYIMYFCCRWQIPASLPTKLESLKFLTLKEVNCQSLQEVSFILFLMRSFPNLQELELQLFGYEEEGAADFIESQDFSDTFSNLRVLTLKGYEGLKNEKLFLELVLSNALHLEHLHVDHNIIRSIIERNRMLGSLKQFVGEASTLLTYTFKK